MNRSQAAVISLRERDYNSKVAPKPTVEMPVPSAEECSKFDNFLQLDEDFAAFDAAALIDWYYNYCSNRWTAFAECPDVVDWWDSCGHMHDPVSLMAWSMIAIPAMTLECKRVFSSTGCLITPLVNRLKEDVIEASECLNAWYKQEPTT